MTNSRPPKTDSPDSNHSLIRPHVLRLRPGQDLKLELGTFVRSHQMTAAFVVAGIGSLQQLSLRLANSQEATKKKGPFEILSLQGTLSHEGVHLHLSVADEKGHCLGGHLLDGCQIFTTAEIMIQELCEFNFQRELDPETGFRELKVLRKP
ncbi:MAG: PPC domain-containing DNA-binding protein [Bdellovibrionales bacterium]